jgi:hypothetical protein
MPMTNPTAISAETDSKHTVDRMLAVMESWGSISPAMRQAGLELRQALAGGATPPIGALGIPASRCIAFVLGAGMPLKQWAAQGWANRPISAETAAGILICALGTIAGRRLRTSRRREVSNSRA